MSHILSGWCNQNWTLEITPHPKKNKCRKAALTTEEHVQHSPPTLSCLQEEQRAAPKLRISARASSFSSFSARIVQAQLLPFFRFTSALSKLCSNDQNRAINEAKSNCALRNPGSGKGNILQVLCILVQILMLEKTFNFAWIAFLKK